MSSKNHLCVKKYQEETKRTLNKRNSIKNRLGELGMGLAGETGELTNLIKKDIYHQHNIDLRHIKEEMGDILWYLSNIANEYNIDLSEVMYENIEKLKTRYPDGYTEKLSIERRDKKQKKITVSTDFSENPGSSPDLTGSRFYEELLYPMFRGLQDNEVLTIDFDGSYGYPPSFLKRAFGQLALVFGEKQVLSKLKFISDEQPGLIEEVINYIKKR